MDITTATELLTFAVRLAYTMFLAGGLVFVGLYIFVMGCAAYLGRNDPYISTNGYWFRGSGRRGVEAANKVNKRLVQVSFLIIVIILF